MDAGAIIWQPYFPPLPVVAVAGLLIALAVLAAVRAGQSSPFAATLALLMRTALIVLLALLLMGPSVLPEADSRPTRPRLTILLDTSASMQTQDVDSRPRYDFAMDQWLTTDRLQRLSRAFDLRLMGFDASPRIQAEAVLRVPAADAATGAASHVNASVSSVAADASPDRGDAVLLLSDGRDSHGQGVERALIATDAAAPVYTVTLGGPNLQRDLSLIAVPLQEFLLEGEEGQIAVRIIQTGAEGSSSTLRVFHNGEEQTFPVTFDDAYAKRVTIPVRHDQPGTYEYEVAIDPIDGEIDERNNRQPVFIEVTHQRLRVLLVEGSPYWDTKFIAQSLRKDDRLEVTQVVQVSAERQQRILSRVDLTSAATTRPRAPAAVPQTLDGWRSYDVVILGSGLENALTAEGARSLVQYVSDFGGRVVFARGRAYDAATQEGTQIQQELAVLEPVVWGAGSGQDLRLALASAGEAHPTLAIADGSARAGVVADIPGFEIAPAVERAKAGTQVLARTSAAGLSYGSAQGQPAIVTMPFNRGQVYAILGDGLWRWSILERRRPALAGTYDRFWSNTIRWLAMGSGFQPGRDVALQLSRRSVQIGEELTVDVSDRSTAADRGELLLTVVAPDGQRFQPSLAPVAGGVGRSRTQLKPDLPGVYRVIADMAGLEQPVEATFSVYELDLERLESSADPHLMRLLAEETGGQVLDPYDPDAFERLLTRRLAAETVPPRPRYAWNEGWIMTLLLTWAGAEWILRKKGGLL